MLARTVASILRDGGVSPVYTVPVPATLDPEPIVVHEGELVLVDDIPDGRRLSSVCSVIVCRTSLRECEAVARSCFAVLNDCDWAVDAWLDGGYRLCGVGCGEPQWKGRDRSGRWLYRVDVTLTIEREDDDA